MKATKGEAGYIQARKKQLILKAVLEFGIVIALLILGIWQTHTRLNLLTVVAVLGCLPAAKALVEVITISPYHSIAEERAKEIQKHAEDLTAAFDLVFTSKDKFMPVDSIIILDNTICGYSSGKKIDPVYTGKHLRQMLEQNQYTKVSVKILRIIPHSLQGQKVCSIWRKQTDRTQRKKKKEFDICYFRFHYRGVLCRKLL